MGEKRWQLLKKIFSGIPEMDQALNHIRLGDNVVWRVSSLQEFRYFCEPYIEQAIRDGRRIIYFRFASHEPLVKECPEVEKIKIPLSHRFEDFMYLTACRNSRQPGLLI